MADLLEEGAVVGGKFRILRLLGAGGMGAVYEVEHQFTKHRRALKLLHKEMLSHPSIVARFLREASAAGHIGNRHIVETFDAGTLAAGEPYIVMEMLEGEALFSRLMRERGSRADVAQLVDIVIQACDGVQAAHDAGIVHRDLKPDNLFLVDLGAGERPFVKVLDFGISKFDAALLANANVATKEGATIGTPYYMSPEQVAGDKTLDGRTDIYALGIILYEGLGGQRPFEADALPMLSVLIHQGKTRPLGELRSDLAPSFIEIVMKAMATDRDRRFPTARALSAALAPFGRAALDATLPETTTYSPSAVRTSPSDAPAPPKPMTHTQPLPLPPPLVAAVSTDGASVSVAEEKVPLPAKKLPLLGIGIAVLLVLGVGGFVVSRMSGGTPPAAVASTASGLVAASVPVDSSVPSALPSPSTSFSAAAMEAASAVPTVAKSTSTAKPTLAPTASGSNRVQQKGLATENPFR